MRINMVGEVDVLDRDSRQLGYVRPEFYQYMATFADMGNTSPVRQVTVPLGYVHIIHTARLELTCDATVIDRTLWIQTYEPISGLGFMSRMSGPVTAGQVGLLEIGPVITSAVPFAAVEVYLKTDPPGLAVMAGNIYQFLVNNVRAGDVWTYAEQVIQLPVP